MWNWLKRRFQPQPRIRVVNNIRLNKAYKVAAWWRPISDMPYVEVYGPLRSDVDAEKLAATLNDHYARFKCTWH